MQVKSTYRNFIAGLVCALLCPAALFAGSPASLLINQFTGIDSVLAVFVRTVRPSKCDSAALSHALENLLHQHAGLSAVALADVRGNVIGFSGYEARSEALSQKVSGREWYRISKKTQQPYYGPLTEAGRRFYCLWSRPVLAPAALGMTACEGVFVAYVNVAECFKDFSRVYRRPFEIGRDTAVFFHTDDWQAGLPFEQEPLGLQGGLEFTLRYTDRPLPDQAAADSPAQAKDSAAATSIQPAAVSPETQGTTGTAPAGPAETAGPVHRSMAWIYFLIAGILVLGVGPAYAVRRERERRKAREEESARAMIIEEEKDIVRKNVKSDMYQEIRSRIGKPEVARIEQEIKAGMYGEIRKTMMENDGESLRRELQTELREKVRAELLEEIRRQLLTTENAALREDARGKLLEELSQRLREEVGGQLEMEALQALTRTIHSEVRAEHAKPLRERAMKDLDERIRQEVAIRERSLLLANARASLKETIEKEVVEMEGSALRKEARTAILNDIRKKLDDAPLSENPAGGRILTLPPEGGPAEETVREVLSDVRGALQKIDESEALLSLVKTVDLLKSSQQGSPYFNLNAAQTSSMIEYLESISDRLQRYVAEAKNGLGRLHRSVERVLRGIQSRDGAAPLTKEQSGPAENKIPEPETLVEQA